VDRDFNSGSLGGKRPWGLCVCVCVYVCVCTCMGIEEMMTGHEGKNHGGFCADVGRS